MSISCLINDNISLFLKLLNWANINIKHTKIIVQHLEQQNPDYVYRVSNTVVSQQLIVTIFSHFLEFIGNF